MKGAKRTIKDVRVGENVRYVNPTPKGTWMKCAWGDEDGLVVGSIYEVLNVKINSLGQHGLEIVGTEFEFWVDVECFELI